MGELRLIEAPPDALRAPAAQRIARSLAGLIALGEERERRLQQQVQAEALSPVERAQDRAAAGRLARHAVAADGDHHGGRRPPVRRLDDDDRELLETITDQSTRMSRMIENLLDLSKLQAGALPPRAPTGSTRASWSRRRSTS